jgi:hypothetical protein
MPLGALWRPICLIRRGGYALKLYCINATSKLGRRVHSGPWSARWIRNKAVTYKNGGFTDIVILDMSAKQEFTLAHFLTHHPLGESRGWKLDA